MAHGGRTMHDTSFDDTLMVPKLPPMDRPRVLAATFAPVRTQPWPWIVLAAVLLAGLGRPLPSRDELTRAAQAKVLLGELTR